MKQKLLLALLALFTSMGMVKAETSLTVPANSPRVTLSFGSPVEITIDGAKKNSASVFYLEPGEEKIYSISGKYTSLTIDGWVSAATIDNDKLSSLIFKNNAQKLTSLTFTSAALTSLNCDNCELTALPTGLMDNLAQASATIVLTKNKITSLNGLTNANYSRSFSVDGNKITTMAALATGSKITINYGTQYLDQTETTSNANEWYDAFAELVTGNSLYGEKYAASDLTFTWKKGGSSSFGTSDVMVNGTYPGQYKFYNASSKEYQTGAFQCQIASKSSSDPKYVFTTITVPSPDYKLSLSATTGGTLKAVKVSDGSEVGNATTLSKGDRLLLSPQASSGYAFREYKTVGFSATSEANEYIVKGNELSTDISIQAVFTANTYAVNVEAGSNGSYKVMANNTEIKSGSTVAVGTNLVITATPAAGYKARVIANNTEIKAEEDGTFKISVAGVTNIKILFEVKVTTPTLTITKNDKITKIMVNGVDKEFTSGNVTINITANTVVTLNVTNATAAIKQVLLNTQPLSGTTQVSFTMPQEDATITYVTTELATISIVAPGKEETISQTKYNVQEYGYTGAKQEYKFTTNPAGISGISVSYAPIKLDNYTSTAPTSVGNYKVKIARSADGLYSKVEEKEHLIRITQAEATIVTAPSVTVASNRTYAVSGGTAQVAGKNIAGTFSVTLAGDKSVVNNVCPIATNHIATVKFTPTDKANVNTATVQVPVKLENTDIKKYKLTYTTPSDIEFIAKNGNAIVKSGTEVANGTLLKISINAPATYTEIGLKEDKSGAEAIEKNADGTYHVTIKDAALALIVTYKGSAPATKNLTLEVETAIEALNYTGAVNTEKLYKANNFTIKGAVEADKTAIQAAMVFTYKNAAGEILPAPINAGKYTVCVSIPAMTGASGNKYTATVANFADKMEIKKATVAITTWPTAATIGFGQTLAGAQFTGGVAPIAGSFAFVQSTTIPVDGNKYDVKFIPADANNYEEVFGTEKVMVTASDKRILSFTNIVNGSVVVKDKAGKVYNSGDELPSSIKEIVITATPSTGYILDKLTVNDETIVSGSTYTLGSKSITVKAEFINSYKVTVNAPTRGLIVTLPASSEVKRGESYSFTIECLAADKPVVTVGSTTLAKGTDGKYTINNILANQTVTIKLDNPTAISVKAEPTLSPGNKEMGKIEFKGLTDGKCFYGDEVTATATPVPNVKFAGWEGLTSIENPLKMIVKEAITLKANYTGSPVGIESIEGMKLEGGLGHIFVSCDGTATLTIVSMNGQSAQIEVSGETRIERAAGVYGVVLQQGSVVLKTKVVVR